jgi:hypothetical protein
VFLKTLSERLGPDHRHIKLEKQILIQNAAFLLKADGTDHNEPSNSLFYINESMN